MGTETLWTPSTTCRAVRTASEQCSQNMPSTRSTCDARSPLAVVPSTLSGRGAVAGFFGTFAVPPPAVGAMGGAAAVAAMTTPSALAVLGSTCRLCRWRRSVRRACE